MGSIDAAGERCSLGFKKMVIIWKGASANTDPGGFCGGFFFNENEMRKI